MMKCLFLFVFAHSCSVNCVKTSNHVVRNPRLPSQVIEDLANANQSASGLLMRWERHPFSGVDHVTDVSGLGELSLHKKNIPGYNPKNFYVIAHMVNRVPALKWAVNRGANSFEVDIGWNDNEKEPSGVWHEFACDCTCLFFLFQHDNVCKWYTCGLEYDIQPVFEYAAAAKNRLFYVDAKLKTEMEDRHGLALAWRGMWLGAYLGAYYLPASDLQTKTKAAVLVGGAAENEHRKGKDGYNDLNFYLWVGIYFERYSTINRYWVAWTETYSRNLSPSEVEACMIRLRKWQSGRWGTLNGVLSHGISTCAHAWILSSWPFDGLWYKFSSSGGNTAELSGREWMQILGDHDTRTSSWVDMKITWTIDSLVIMKAYINDYKVDGYLTNDVSRGVAEAKKYSRSRNLWL